MKSRDLLSIDDLSTDEIFEICRLAQVQYSDLDKKNQKNTPSSHRSAIGLVFLEASTRTRTSFERAAQLQGRPTILIESKGTSVEKGESLHDTVLTLHALDVGLFVIRTPVTGGLEELRSLNIGPVVNAGDGTGEHPTQALSDLAALSMTLGDPSKLKGFRMGIVGDLRHSRVARSWSYLAKKIGIELSLLSPPEWKPEDWGQGLPWTSERTGFLERQNALMALRVQKERIADLNDRNLTAFSQSYQFRDSDLGEKQWLLHPGPTNWGVELDPSLLENPRSLIRKQVRMGLAVRSVLLSLLEKQ